MTKTKLFIFTLLALTLAGCEDNRTPEQRQKAFDADIACHIKTFNYQGHRYLLYEKGSQRGGVAGITHDPDCPCHKRNNITENKYGENESDK